MEAIFMNTKNSKTNEPHRLSLADKLNLENPNKSIALGNSSIYYTWKNIKSEYTRINLKFLLQLGMILLICLTLFILLQIFKTTLNSSSKNMKL